MHTPSSSAAARRLLRAASVPAALLHGTSQAPSRPPSAWPINRPPTHHSPHCAPAPLPPCITAFSVFNADKYPNVPLMNIKACTEDFLKSTALDYTVIRLCGFMQVC